MKYTLLKEQLALKLGITLHPGEGTVEKDHITLIAGSRFTQPEVVPPGTMVLDSWYKDAGFTMPATDGTKVDITFSNLYAYYIELYNCTIFETVSGTSLAYFNKVTLDKRYDKFFIDWGDGVVETFKATQTDVTHNYATAGKYTIKISEHASEINITSSSSINRRIEKINSFSSNIKSLPLSFCYNQTSLTQANLNGLTSLGQYSFEGCSNVTFTNYDSVVTFLKLALWKCDKITDFTLPRTTTSLEEGWLNSTSLTSLTVDPLNTVFSDLGLNVIYRASDKTLYAACKNSNLDFTTYNVDIEKFNRSLSRLNVPDKDIILPATYKNVVSYEFEDTVAKSIDMSNCTLLTNLGTSLWVYPFNRTTLSESFTLPPNITTLYRNTFNNVKGNGFATITLPPSFRKFDVYYVFNGPSNGAIKKVIFQNSEFDMSTPIDHPFYDCNELTEISFEAIVDPAKIPPMSTSLFENDRFSNDLVIYVANEEMKTAFENATNWNKYAGRYQIRGQ